MAADLGIPNLTYEDLRVEADKFLAQYHPSRSLPVPIEEIVEFDLGLNIIPLPGLQEAFEIESFISSDLKSISVDKFIFEHYANRYRFSLAHEIGHRALHRKQFARFTFRTIDEYKSFIQGIGDVEYKTLEWQAYSFAGLVLVPTDELHAHIRTAKAKASQRGFNLARHGDIAFDFIASWLARAFVVSTAVIERRIKYDRLWP